MSYKLGIDVGGTFTDLLLFHEETKEIYISKVPSTPSNPSVGVYHGIGQVLTECSIDPERIEFLIHGTTVATNAILEHKGVKTALICTRGFQDILHIGRQDRPKLYDFFEKRPKPLIPRRLRYQVTERTLHTGEIEEELNIQEVEEIIEKIREEEIFAVAVCLLHSYANPFHEQQIKEIFAKKSPEVKVSISSEILPEYREYERMSTTVINSYVTPLMEKYLSELHVKMKEGRIKSDLHIMQSNGGVMTSKTAEKKSVHTVLSGPCAGALGALEIGVLAGFENTITVDMGGTSFDISLASKGRLRNITESEVAGYPIKIPMVDISTIGAGGGSIAWIDEGGALRVGPESAGALPGPVCYRKGGSLPTVTDANLVLGRLNPHNFLGGRMKIDYDGAREVIEKTIATPLSLELEEAAEGIIRVVNASMMKGIRKVSVERGFDPREFVMISYGGCGPLHTSELARELGIPKVLIPQAPGVLSALGLLMADFRHDYVTTYLREVSSLSLEEFNERLRDMEIRAVEQMVQENVPEESILLKHSLDMRYLGQGYELEIPIEQGLIEAEDLQKVLLLFHDTHALNYGYSVKEDLVEIVNIRVTSFGRLKRPELKKKEKIGEDPIKALQGRREAYWDGQYHKTSIYNRDRLQPGDTIVGPAVIEQLDSTVVVFPHQVASVDEYYNLVISTGG